MLFTGIVVSIKHAHGDTNLKSESDLDLLLRVSTEPKQGKDAFFQITPQGHYNVHYIDCIWNDKSLGKPTPKSVGFLHQSEIDAEQ